MILSDRDIQRALRKGLIRVSPTPDTLQFNSSSLDLRLNGEFKKFNPELLEKESVEVCIDYSKIANFSDLASYFVDLRKETDGSVIIKRKSFILAQTLEKITLPLSSKIAARVEGRSSAARLGLVVHLTAPTIHAGFSGKITLEIMNHGPCDIRLDPKKDRICQLVFEQIATKPSKANLSQFHGQRTVLGRKTRKIN